LLVENNGELDFKLEGLNITLVDSIGEYNTTPQIYMYGPIKPELAINLIGVYYRVQIYQSRIIQVVSLLLFPQDINSLYGYT